MINPSDFGTAHIDWQTLGFDFVATPFRFRAHWSKGSWSDGELCADSQFAISESATALNYGQQAFEGLKAFSLQNGGVAVFRPEENAKRLQRSADRLVMPQVPTDLFLQAVKDVVLSNAAYLPPHGTGASFYLRPLLLGVGNNLGLHPAKEYLFTVFGCPVGAYFASSDQTVKLMTTDIHRAAPKGIGHVKAGGNYASTLMAKCRAQAAGFDEVLYLDAATDSMIEEAGAANFFAIKGNRFITPQSASILPSVTRISLLELAAHIGMEVEERPIPITELDSFDEVGCCGTAVHVAGISVIQTEHKRYQFDEYAGSVTQRLHELLHAIQLDDASAPALFSHWRYDIHK